MHMYNALVLIWCIGRIYAMRWCAGGDYMSLKVAMMVGNMAMLLMW